MPRAFKFWVSSGDGTDCCRTPAERLTPRSVGGIIQLGGTILHTLRCPSFEEEGGVEKGAETLSINNVDGLVVIGGDGSFRGALDLSRESDALMVGVPATIDNDVYGTEETIGFDTAVNTAVGTIDKIRDTAICHERIFVVEVMGRKRGFLALEVGICVGAEVILIPERPMTLADIVKLMDENAKKGKRAGIIVAAEGCGNTSKLAAEMQQQTEAEVRLVNSRLCAARRKPNGAEQAAGKFVRGESRRFNLRGKRQHGCWLAERRNRGL